MRIKMEHALEAKRCRINLTGAVTFREEEECIEEDEEEEEEDDEEDDARDEALLAPSIEAKADLLSFTSANSACDDFAVTQRK